MMKESLFGFIKWGTKLVLIDQERFTKSGRGILSYVLRVKSGKEYVTRDQDG